MTHGESNIKKIKSHLVCLAIPACYRIAGLIIRPLNSSWGLAYANGYPCWSFQVHLRQISFYLNNFDLQEGKLWLEGFLGFEPRVAQSQLKGRDGRSKTLVKPPHMWGNAGRAPTFELYPRIWLTAEEKSRKNLSHGREKVPSGHDSYRRFGQPWLS